MNIKKTLLIPSLVLAVIIPACNSNKVVASTPTNLGSSGTFQPTLTKLILPTATMPPGKSQSNPAPVGSDVNADNMKFIVTGTVRPADGIVSSGSMFNPQPGEYQQYIFVTLHISCETSTDQLCRLSIFKMALLGSDGILIYPERIITGVDDILENTDFYGGETISGNIPFIIFIGDSHLQLIYKSLSGESIYLALP